MPNWCSNSFQLTGKSKRIEELHEFIEERGGKQWFDFFVEPAKDDETTDWYSYNLENYGCKWNCDALDWSIEDIDKDRSRITISFDSPWGPPITLYETISEDESLEVYAEYHEEGIGFVGKFEDCFDNFYEYRNEEDLNNIPEDLVENWNLRELLEMQKEEDQDYDYMCNSCDWKGTIDELHYENEIDDGVCPECKSRVSIYE